MTVFRRSLCLDRWMCWWLQDLDLTWTDPGKAGSWVANARIPVKEPRTASVSFKRKFAFN